MMNLNQAMKHAKANGCKYYVKNEMGCVLGAYQTRNSAELCKAMWERRYRENPFGSQDVKVYIEEK